MLFKAKVPGSLMLLGEHAVLHGQHALVCAVDQYMTVILEPRTDTQIKIDSALLGQMTTDIKNITAIAPFQFVLTALKKYQQKLPSGCHITIQSDFSDKIGLGSSAAVTVAVVMVLMAWLKIPYSSEKIIREARAIIQTVQGLGSGADVAASVLGGIVFYKMQPFIAEKLSYHCPLTVMYAGYKTPTVQVVNQVKKFFADYPALFKQLCVSINACVLQGMKSIEQQDWESVGKIMTIQQGLMNALQVSTPLLNQLIENLIEQPAILGAKISGSGLGDCLIGLGSVTPSFIPLFVEQGVKLIPVAMSADGACYEKN
jgi:mevalonate kinase